MSLVPVPDATDAPPSVSEWQMIQQQAEILAQSDIVPAAYRRKPANIVVAALTGRSFGWDPLTAMRLCHVIEGKATISAEGMLALARAKGHSISGESTDQGATCIGTRADTGDTMTVTFTMADAARAGLAGKGTWKQYPAAMCWARAVSQLCRMLFPDVLAGLSYTPEEIGGDYEAPVAEAIEDTELEALKAAHDSLDLAQRVAFDAWRSGAALPSPWHGHPDGRMAVRTELGRLTGFDPVTGEEIVEGESEAGVTTPVAAPDGGSVEEQPPPPHPVEDAVVVEDRVAKAKAAIDAVRSLPPGENRAVKAGLSVLLKKLDAELVPEPEWAEAVLDYLGKA